MTVTLIESTMAALESGNYERYARDADDRNKIPRWFHEGSYVRDFWVDIFYG
jgi:hypothetical protein